MADQSDLTQAIKAGDNWIDAATHESTGLEAAQMYATMALFAAVREVGIRLEIAIREASYRVQG